jgi:hypothetical protein
MFNVESLLHNFRSLLQQCTIVSMKSATGVTFENVLIVSHRQDYAYTAVSNVNMFLIAF